ncbi:hypothetical protein EJ06DRAFT_526482 [Trichodelitschia bisporula]|uniref:Roadblock/LAMTOR2 domain-containing protein n=1 Tax=Trichodelitschia bisporula TaxID=703511 RepID=A0A6G1I8F0_9PEZI|nr:hypothetical protein EJ06DRAFT_526482 [Trichodelitschia bisporula]
MGDSGRAEMLAQVTRLGQKPGVQSTLLLARESGAIISTSGLVSKSSEVNPDSILPASQDDPAEGYANGLTKGGLHNAEDVARLVLNFVETASTLAGGIDAEEEVKLLRVRTKKNELVIVPSAKYILVAIHDTPPA